MFTAEKVFGNWKWCSNIDYCQAGCRLLIGWNHDVVNLKVLHMSQQTVLCVIEVININVKCFCSFAYAANDGAERRNLWRELTAAKSIINVTLKTEEHSAGGSHVTNDMQDFIDCVNNIKVEDVYKSGLYFTWIKSPLKASTSILKKLRQNNDQ